MKKMCLLTVCMLFVLSCGCAQSKPLEENQDSIGEKKIEVLEMDIKAYYYENEELDLTEINHMKDLIVQVNGSEFKEAKLIMCLGHHKLEILSQANGGNTTAEAIYKFDVVSREDKNYASVFYDFKAPKYDEIIPIDRISLLEPKKYVFLQDSNGFKVFSQGNYDGKQIYVACDDWEAGSDLQVVLGNGKVLDSQDEYTRVVAFDSSLKGFIVQEYFNKNYLIAKDLKEEITFGGNFRRYSLSNEGLLSIVATTEDYDRRYRVYKVRVFDTTNNYNLIYENEIYALDINEVSWASEKIVKIDYIERQDIINQANDIVSSVYLDIAEDTKRIEKTEIEAQEIDLYEVMSNAQLV